MSEAPSRVVLPIPDQVAAGLVTYDAKDPDASFTPITPLRPPAGAPNVLVVLLDDVGFGASSAFGGPCQTPVAERLATEGLKYTRFHTTALCSPTRAALLSGRNHHSVGMGGITEIATSAPGYSSLRPNSCAPLAETLRLNGYSTAQFGKCHEVPVWETSPQGPFDRWPTPGNGFEYFFGFIGGETNQWYPSLYENTVAIEPHKSPEEGYHFTEDMTDRAIGWVRSQKALTPDKPFFIYFAPGACHAPHHVPKEWADKYRGQFDQGWDRVREETLARQKTLGVVPQDCELTARSDGIPAWDDMPDAIKPVLAREMEVYAGFLEHTDHHLGRLIDAIEALGALDDTLVFVIIGDNGASAEGTMRGTFNEYLMINHATELETDDLLASKIDDLGTPASYNHYAIGWAHAMDTPYQWTKQVASHWGGTRNGTIVHWPNGFQSRGEIRAQFGHVIDVAPTVLEAAGLPQPTMVHGVLQQPMHGTSLVYSFDGAEAAERHETQYFEMMCNRGIYHKGWSAVTLHKKPWLSVAEMGNPQLDDDDWELYDGTTDWSQARNVAGEHSDKLHELQRLFLIEATKYNVLPLDDRSAERFNADIAGRPQLIKGNSQMLYAGMTRLSENSVLQIKNKSYAVTAELIVPDTAPNGVIVAQGGSFGGWSVYVTDGVVKYCYNLLGIKQFITAADGPLTAGTRQVRVEFTYDGGGIGKGGDVSLYVDGNPIGKGRVEATEPFNFSMDETTDVGCETGTPVSNEYGHTGNAFTGTINWARLDIGEDNHDHLIDPEDLVQIALTRQ